MNNVKLTKMKVLPLFPIDKNAQVAIVFYKNTYYNSNSNGTIGNNIYPQPRTHLNVADIIDGNVDYVVRI